MLGSISLSRLCVAVNFVVLISLIILPRGSVLQAQTGDTLDTITLAEFKKSNQSKIFYHDGKWWAIAYDKDERNAWFIWKYENGVWSKDRFFEQGRKKFPDAVVDTANNKLYIYGSNHKKPKFRRYTYDGNTWRKDDGFPVEAFSDFTDPSKTDPINMIKAANGRLWLFRIRDSKLQAKYSDDEGLTWSSVVTIKSPLNTTRGVTDAVVFSSGGSNYVGLGYGERNGTGSVYGFLYHQDGDPDTTWTDESASLTFFGAEHARNHMSMTVDSSNNIYMFVYTIGASGSDPNNILYKRSSAGSWTAYKVNTSTTWSSPAVVVDGQNNNLYLFGINTSSKQVEYKFVTIGQESTFESATIDTALANGSDEFVHISVPTGQLNSTTGLMIAGGNETADDVWFNLISLTAAGLTAANVIPYPPEADSAAHYTIGFRVGSNGAMTTTSDSFLVCFDSLTTISDGAITGATVNGVAATATADSTAHTVSIMLPASVTISVCSRS